ncbi:MAG: oxidoreductase [Acidobacteria bacterium]|nr:MAG: oxidoreductase [Acidobacteriota bacterium]
MENKPITRRDFVKTSALGAGAALGALYVPRRAFGANDRISLGLVGPGGRAQELIKWVYEIEGSHNVEFTAVCDIWNQRREAAAQKFKEHYNRDVRKCRTVSEIVALKDVDGLVIATADFQHAYHLAAAVKAGKDVYCEKPLGCDFDTVKAAWKTVKESDRVVQIGTQSRSVGKYRGARDFIRSGRLGKVTFVEIYEPIFEERWRIPGSETSLREEDTDWKEFLAYLDPKKYKWNPRHYREFRLFWPFSSGCFCQWMSHRIDLVNLVLDELPRYAVASGGVYLWKDGRTNPDTAQALVEYPSGVLVTYHMRMGNKANRRGILVYGTNGTMDLDEGIAYGDGGGGEVVAEHPGDPATRFIVDPKRVLAAKKDGGARWESPPDQKHMANFVDCMRSRTAPLADIDAGFGHAVATILANLSYRNGVRMEYDPARREMRKAPAGEPPSTG